MNIVVGIFLLFFTLEFLVEFFLNELNVREVLKSRAARKVPDFFQGKISHADYQR